MSVAIDAGGRDLQLYDGVRELQENLDVLHGAFFQRTVAKDKHEISSYC